MWAEEALENYASAFYVRDGSIDHLGADVPSSPVFLFAHLMTESSRNTTHEYVFSIKSSQIADKAGVLQTLPSRSVPFFGEEIKEGNSTSLIFLICLDTFHT